VKLLLQDKRVDPTAFGNHAMRLAMQNGHTEIVELLVGKTPVNSTTSQLCSCLCSIL
jgi:hypothetical protein